MRPGAELSATGVSLMALMERVHSDGAIPPGRKYFLLMKPVECPGPTDVRCLFVSDWPDCPPAVVLAGFEMVRLLPRLLLLEDMTVGCCCCCCCCGCCCCCCLDLFSTCATFEAVASSKNSSTVSLLLQGGVTGRTLLLRELWSPAQAKL